MINDGDDNNIKSGNDNNVIVNDEELAEERMINLINYPFYSASCRARNPMLYLSIDIAPYDDKRHCRPKLFIVISSSLSAIINVSDENGST